MKVGELQEVVDRIRAVCALGGSKLNERGLAEFAELLQGRADQDVEDFIADLEMALKGSRRTTLRKADEAVVERHVQALEAAGIDREAFEQALSALQADRDVQDAEADMIFKRYHSGAHWRDDYGERPRWHRRADALKALAKSFQERLTRAQKLETVGRSTPW